MLRQPRPPGRQISSTPGRRLALLTWSTSTSVRRLAARRAQELLGYALYDASSVGGGYLGYHDMSDPMRLFD